ncbi:transposable element Tc1 transposase [Trichonephila clavipes]|nr:transposable element Tc1 transposase [Trichonephila clavipes]
MVIRGTLTAQWYADDILPFLLQYPGLIFQQDNAKPYEARVAMNYVIVVKHFPGQPDHQISSIGHVWHMIRRQLHLPGNVDDLSRQLEQIWQEVPQKNIRVLYHSMSRRVAACIETRGGSTRY